MRLELNDLNGSPNHAHTGHVLYGLHDGWWTVMSLTFMNVLNVLTLPIDYYINYVITHSLSLLPEVVNLLLFTCSMLEVDCLLSLSHSYGCHVIGFELPTCTFGLLTRMTHVL